MEERELEEKLQKSANAIPTRDFSEVWKNIQDRVTAPRSKKRRRWIYAVVSSVAAIVIICAVGIPYFLRERPNDEIKAPYFVDSLISNQVENDEFFEKIESSEVNCINFRRYIVSNCFISQTAGGIVIGGKIGISDNVSAPTFVANIKFYDKAVDTRKIENIYDLSCIVNGAVIEYSLISSDVSYVYIIKANYNSVNYFMKLTYFSEDIQSFFSSFFQ